MLIPTCYVWIVENSGEVIIIKEKQKPPFVRRVMFVRKIFPVRIPLGYLEILIGTIKLNKHLRSVSKLNLSYIKQCFFLGLPSYNTTPPFLQYYPSLLTTLPLQSYNTTPPFLQYYPSLLTAPPFPSYTVLPSCNTAIPISHHCSPILQHCHSHLMTTLPLP